MIDQPGVGAALRVVIDGRLVSGQSGGVEAVIAGLASGLSKLQGSEEYIFAVGRGHEAWLAPYVSGPARIEAMEFDPPNSRSPTVRLLERFGRAGRQLAAKTYLEYLDAAVPAFDPQIERLNPSLVHMLRQRGFLTSARSIYHPHDLQHVHLPEFFSDKERTWRERVYGALCRQASMVAVASEWTRGDVVHHFGLADDKVRVVRLAPPLGAARAPSAAEQRDARSRYALPDQYVLYPAQTWPHKNHIRLLQALAKLRDESGLIVPLVATGTTNAHFDEIAMMSARLGLEAQVVWTGFVPAIDLRAIYLGARAVVIPSLFEAASGPLWEAFLSDVPAACSNVTSLPDQAGDAAALFDPLDIEAMAGSIRVVWQDEAVRQGLVLAGRRRIENLSWQRTAETFRAHYRRIAGRPMSEEDLVLTGATA